MDVGRLPNGLELSRPQGPGMGSFRRSGAAGAMSPRRLNLAAPKRACLGELTSLEDYLPLKPESQAASTAQARRAMRVGSSELFGSPGDAQGVAREPWQAQPSWGDESTP